MHNKFIKVKIRILVNLSFILLNSCENSVDVSKTKLQISAENKFGFNYNQVRKKNNLPIIPKNWKILQHQDNEIEFGTSLNIYHTKGYVGKSVFYNDDLTIAKEVDFFYSGFYK